MKKIIIKADKNNAFLRTEALQKAILFEEVHMNERKEGWRNGVIWCKPGFANKIQWQFYVYHTKTAIVVSINTYHPD